MHTRERLLAIEPRDNGLIAYSLRTHDEVRDPAEAFEDIPKATKADPAMVEIAEKIIAQQSGAFDPDKFTDRYEDALKKLIAARRGKRQERSSRGQSPAPKTPTSSTSWPRCARKPRPERRKRSRERAVSPAARKRRRSHR